VEPAQDDTANSKARPRHLHGAALLFFVVMAVVHSWPLASNLGGLARLDNHDAESLTWTIAWVAHILPRAPWQLFDAPIFYPEQHSLAFSEHMFVPSVLGAPLLWTGVSPVAVYNVLIIAGLALSGWVMFLVMERWTGNVWAAVIAGLVYAFNAHVLTRFVHLQAQHVEFFPIMLYAFDRVLVEARRRDVMLLAAAFVLQALCSNYLLVFSAYALVVTSLVRWREVGARRNELMLAGAISVIAMGPFLFPYYQVNRDKGLTRSLQVVSQYNAHWRDYLATGGRLHYATWSRQFYGGANALFPGFTALALAVIAVTTGRGSRDRRIQSALAIAALGLAFSFGTALPGYSLLHNTLPLLNGLRNVARWGWLVLAAVAILAGFGAAALGKRLARWPQAAVVLCVLVTAESIRTPVGFTPFAGLPAIYDRLAGEPSAIVAEFPFYSGADISLNGSYVLANTRYFRALVNGYSSLQPESFETRGRALRSFPSATALAELSVLHVTHVVVHRDRFRSRFGQAALDTIDTVPELERIADEGEIRLYRMR